MRTDPRPVQIQDQIRKAVDDIGQPHKARRGIDHAKHALPGGHAIQIAQRALQQVDDPARGDALADALERVGGNLNVGGLRISFDKAQHRGTRFVELGILSGGRLRR